MLPFGRVSAAQRGPGDWVEVRLSRFVVLGPATLAKEIQLFASLYERTLESTLDEFGRLYGDYPPLPVNISIYRDANQFRNLNATVPPMRLGGYHAHLGAREIALIMPLPEGVLTSRAAANVIRHELNALFLSALAGDDLPLGLAVGLNQYVEHPGPQTSQGVQQMRLQMQTRGEDQLLPWRELFETEAVYFDNGMAYQQARSVVAFLADSYGFPPLVALLRSMGAGQPYRNAFTEVYRRSMDQLELDWRAYLPTYLDQRWQSHVLFNYDLAPLRQGLEAGAYTQVHRALEQILPFLELTGQTEAFVVAQALQATAAAGIEAGELVQAQRDALQAGDLEAVLYWGAEARATYAKLDDASRSDEIESYAARATALLDLRAELAAASALVGSGNGQAAEARLLMLAPRFQELGDTASRDETAALLELLHAEHVAAAKQAAASIEQQIRWIGVLALLILLHRGAAIAIGWRRRTSAVL